MRVCSSKPAISIDFNGVNNNNLAGYEECTRVLYMIQKKYLHAITWIGHKDKYPAIVGWLPPICKTKGSSCLKFCLYKKFRQFSSKVPCLIYKYYFGDQNCKIVIDQYYSDLDKNTKDFLGF